MRLPSPTRTDVPASEEILGTHPREQLAQASLAILSELENSLHRSQKALLALDGAALEILTEEQARLSRALHICFLPTTPCAPPGKSTEAAGLSRSPSTFAPRPELHAAASRVAHLARVQAALVRRAQRLRVLLSNFKSDPGEIYSPMLFDQGANFRDTGPE